MASKLHLPVETCPEADSDPGTGTRMSMKSAILLVDDSDSLRSVLARYLTLHGYAVLEARSYVEALQACDEFAGGIPLLVTDISLPHMSGIELAERVTAIRPEAAVL